MRGTLCVALVTFALGLLGCSSVPSYTRFDLKQDLSPDTRARFEREAQGAAACCAGATMTQLESTNGWPLGILAYWWQGSVMRTEVAPGKPSYMVANSQGFGPISLLYVTSTHATYDGQGRRVSSMTSGSVLLGHLAMLHRSENVLPDGRIQEVRMYHLLHHLIGIHSMDGHTNISLFTSPNPLGATFAGAAGGTP